MKGIAWIVLVVGFALSAVTGAAPAQRAGLPPLDLESLAGGDSFAFYCASCHGTGGRGDGPVAATLRAPPADLTLLTERNAGQFPAVRIRELLTGEDRAPAAHGSTDMPVWGPIFRGLGASEARNTQRLANIVAHLESLQRPTTFPADAGAVLFRAHCASCHGVNARGDGPVAEALRVPPPDLTRFTERNSGVFPRERLYRIVDGRGVAAHGRRDMPVWGDVFRRAADATTNAAVAARIERLVNYLEAIQRRATD